MADHIGVGGVSQRAVTLTGFDAAAELIGFGGSPYAAEVVVVLAQIAGAVLGCAVAAVLRSLAPEPSLPTEAAKAVAT